MRLVFCGTPDFAVPTLRAVLDAGHEVVLVLTQPDRPAGRRMELQVPPVKQLALQHGLEVQQPERIRNNDALRARLEAERPDAILVVAYGRIIPPWMLQVPRFGNLNLHGSLLPKYRGAAPIQWAVANGETETGVSTMLLDEGLDTGDVLLERRVPIGPETTASALFTDLAELGAALMLETLRGLESGSIKPRKQDGALATGAPILTREDGRLELGVRTAQQVFDRWRGFYPWPGAFATFRGKRFLVHRMHLLPGENPGVLAPGELQILEGRLLTGACGESLLALDEVQLEGKPRMSGEAFARACALRPGERID